VRQANETRPAATAFGALLILVGVALLAVPRLGSAVLAVGWPLFVIVPGLALLAAAFSARPGRGVGFLAVPAAVVTTAGLVLGYQNATGDWQSWSYAWALVAPTAVGIGLLVAGARESVAGVTRVGAWLAAIGGLLFLAGEVFFVRLLGVGGAGLGALGAFGLPVVLVATGALLIVRALASVGR